MSNKDVHRISHLISEDPDIAEDDDGIKITYTNWLGETGEYVIHNAWPRYSGGRNFIGFSVQWPNGTFGFFKTDGLSPESYKLLEEEIAGTSRRAYWQYKTIRSRMKKKRLDTKPSPARLEMWRYMFMTYGRCCPKWHVQGHITQEGDCWQADEIGRSITGTPDPHLPRVYEGTYLGGDLQIDYEDDLWHLQMMGENPEVFESAYELTEYLEEILGVEDMEAYREEINEKREGERWANRNNPPSGPRVNLRAAQGRFSDPKKPEPKPEQPTVKTIESDYGPITITKNDDGSVSLEIEGEEPIGFEDPKMASDFLRDQLGIYYLIERKGRRSGVLLEGITPDDITRILTEMGYEGIEFLIPNDGEFKRIDIMGGAFEDGKSFELGEPMTDTPMEKMKRAIQKIESGDMKEIDPVEMEEEIEGLKDDATLFVTAYKQVGEKFIGITVMSLDDPNMQFDMPDWQSDEDEEQIDAVSVDDLESWFNAPSYGE